MQLPFRVNLKVPSVCLLVLILQDRRKDSKLMSAVLKNQRCPGKVSPGRAGKEADRESREWSPWQV